MSKFIKAGLALAIVATVSACFRDNARQEEIVIVEPAPIMAEPVLNKY